MIRVANTFRSRSTAGLWLGVGAVLIYAVVGLAATWTAFPLHPNFMRQGDPSVSVWELSWFASLLTHGGSFFFTKLLNYPVGINLMLQTDTPLLGLLVAPITLLAGPIVAYNVLLWLAFPVSGAAMYFVLRKWTSWWPAAFLGGLFYAFSPYMDGQDSQHVFLVFVPIPPLLFYTVYRLLIARDRHQLRWGVLLGILVTVQFFISIEVDVTTILFATIGLALLGLIRPREVPSALRHAVGGFGLAFAIVAMCVGYPAWYLTAGRGHIAGSAPSGGLTANVLGTVIPTTFERLAPGAIGTYGDHLVRGATFENGSYLGVPLLLLLAFLAARSWKVRWIRFTVAMVVVSWVLTLGARLAISNIATGIPLPFALLDRLPHLDSLAPARLSLYVTIFTSILLAIGCDSYRDRRKQALALTPRFDRPSKKALRVSVWGITAVAVVATLLPRWPLSTAPVGVPSYFTSSAVDNIPRGSVVLMSPYPSVFELVPQVFQAVSGMRFSLIGGYAFFIDSSGGSTAFSATLHPEDVETYMWANATGGVDYPLSLVPKLDKKLVTDARRFLQRYRVGSVIATSVGANPEASYLLFTRVLGPPSQVTGTWGAVGAVAAWYDVPKLLRQASLKAS